MDSHHSKNEFVRYLKDEKFILWQLMPTHELDAYWTDFAKKNPCEVENLILAKEHFKRIKLAPGNLSVEKKEKAIKRLENATRTYRRRQKIRLFSYVASACVLAIALWVTYLQTTKFDEIAAIENSLIVGHKLNDQDIQLITNNTTTTFKQNTEIEVGTDGLVKVKTEENGEKDEVVLSDIAMNKVIVPCGKRSKILLPDGTSVWLNSGTTLEFPSSFEKNKREINLIDGEIYIEVAHNKEKPFFVQTNNFNVHVLGTKFNVRTYQDHAHSVALLEGSVQLKSGAKNSVSVLPSELATFTQSGYFVKESLENINDVISWVNGYYVFRETPIVEVLEQIERYYNISFNYDDVDNLQNRTCSGKLFLSDCFDDVMNTIALLSQTTYSRKDKTIYIRNKIK